MKKPREVLLEQHRSAEPRLDARRQQTVARLAASPARTSGPEQHPRADRLSFRDMVRSFRWHLAGLSAAWALTMFLNAEPASPTMRSTASRDSSESRELVTALRENRRKIEILLESPTLTSGPEPEPPAFVPKRRGELRTSIAIA